MFNCSPGLITPRLIASKERYERLYFNEGKIYNRKHLNKLGTLLYRRENLFEKVQVTKTIGDIFTCIVTCPLKVLLHRGFSGYNGSFWPSLY